MTLMQEAIIEFLLRREVLHSQGSLLTRQEIILLEAQSIRAVGKGDVHHLSIFLSLL